MFIANVAELRQKQKATSITVIFDKNVRGVKLAWLPHSTAIQTVVAERPTLSSLVSWSLSEILIRLSVPNANRGPYLNSCTIFIQKFKLRIYSKYLYVLCIRKHFSIQYFYLRNSVSLAEFSSLLLYFSYLPVDPQLVQTQQHEKYYWFWQY